VISYTVREKTREIGIRMAVGATPLSIRNLVLGQTAWLAAVGIAIGAGIAAACTRLLGGLIYGVRPTDPASFVLAAVSLGVATLLASYAPAKRAMNIDPILALRDE
jgi:ABC-type antimicrobial peptide transport system permease subunit